MKILSLQENLKQGLFNVGHIANKNVNLPILNNILLKTENGNIKMISTNLEMGISSLVRGKIEQEGSLTVDAKVISDCVNLLPNKKVTLEQKETNLMINCDNYKAKIRGLSAEEFPLIPAVDRKIYFSAISEDFKQAIAQVIYAVATSESRLELSGVLFIFGGSKLTLAATDSYRLAEKKINIKTNSEADRKIIIPARTLQELARILSAGPSEEITDENKEIKFFLSDNQILFIYGSTELVSRLIEGQYPDYEQIIPTASKTKVIADRAELIRAVKMASLFSKTGINDINLDFPIGRGQVVVSAISGQTGENVTTLAAKVQGADNSIVVNYRYLLDGLNNMNSESVKIEIIDSNTPCIMRPEKGDNFLYIIMPIKQ